MFVKINGTLVKKTYYLIEIYVRELHNDMILPSSEGIFLVQEQLMETFAYEIRNLGSTCQNI